MQGGHKKLHIMCRWKDHWHLALQCLIGLLLQELALAVDFLSTPIGTEAQSIYQWPDR